MSLHAQGRQRQEVAMDRYCPNCGIEMIDKNHVSICPRNDIGECSYDGYQNTLEQASQEYTILGTEKRLEEAH